MDAGFGQIIWAIIFVVFLIVTILRNRARVKTSPSKEIPRGNKQRTVERNETLGNLIEEVFGMEGLVRKPKTQKRKQKSKVSEKEPGTRQKIEKPGPKVRSKIGEFTHSLPLKVKEEKKHTHISKEERVYKTRPWKAKSKEALQDAIVFAEIIGPPIAKRKNHRIF
ncbi:MAG: hypothetical protein GY941_17195 [Planctomycetes bacterium]|nr:hypothetical protein [Planctomycetota bacterium]